MIRKMIVFVRKHITETILFLLALFVAIPLWMLFSGSFMSTGELVDTIGPVIADANGIASWPLLPQYPTLQPMVELLLDSPAFFKMFWNTCLLVFPILAGQLVVAVPAAWAFARYSFRGKKLLFTLYIVLMLMPFQVTMVSSFLVLDGLSLLNTRYAVILPAVFSTFPVFLMVKFFASIPKTVLEAAEIDGASAWAVFWHIGLPLGMPGVISALVLGFLEYWNAIEAPLTFLQDQSLWPLSLYLPGIVADKAGVSLMASIIMMLPALLIFLLGQRHLEQGIRSSGLKE